MKSFATCDRLANKTTLQMLITAVPMRTATWTVIQAVQGRPAPARHGWMHLSRCGWRQASSHRMGCCNAVVQTYPPRSLPIRVLAAPPSPWAAKKHSACILKVIPIMLMVCSGFGNRPDSMTIISNVHQSRPAGGARSSQYQVSCLVMMLALLPYHAHIMTIEGTARCMYSGHPLHASQLNPRQVRCEHSCRRVCQIQ